MSMKNHHKTKIQIGTFCHKCRKDNFYGNTQSLASQICYCKPSVMTSLSSYNTRRKHLQDNPDLQFHDSGTDPFPFLVRKRKDCPNSSNLVTPKTKEVQFLGAPAAGSQSSILLDTMNGDVDDVNSRHYESWRRWSFFWSTQFHQH
jgi:hypothetical protein